MPPPDPPPDTPVTVRVTAASAAPRLVERARALAERLGLATATPGADVDQGHLSLTVTPTHLELRGPGDAVGRGVRVDFSALARPGSPARLTRRQPLARAVGRRVRTVVDATAGLGVDAGRLACLGYRVTAIERCPILAALLADGIRRADADPDLRAALGGRLSILEGDALERLATLDPAPDAVYVDPMFPPRRKESALAAKRIRLVRRLVGDDADATALLAAARRCARRVVVKRPARAAPIAGTPTASFEGKIARYDVYVG